VLIGDFGWARLKKTGTNPAVNTANDTKTASFWGVGPETDARYDHHMFLNELRKWINDNSPSRFPRTRAFLDVAIPSGYRGNNGEHVLNWRLKYADPCEDLPSLSRLIASQYISGQKRVTSAELVRTKAPLRKIRLAPTPIKRTFTNKELINMSAANFIKLSPFTKARAKNLRVKAPNKKAVVEKPNITARIKKVASPLKINKKRKPFPVAILKTAKFNKFVTKIYSEQGAAANELFGNAWDRARKKAMNIVQNRVNRNMEPLSLSPPKPPPAAKPKPPPAASLLLHKISPKSGRVKIKALDSGRYVYANGSTISMNYLKGLAKTMGVNVKGVRSKANLVQKLFPS